MKTRKFARWIGAIAVLLAATTIAYSVGAQRTSGSDMAVLQGQMGKALGPSPAICVCTQRGMEGRGGRVVVGEKGVTKKYLELSCEIPLFEKTGARKGSQPCLSYRVIGSGR